MSKQRATVTVREVGTLGRADSLMDVPNGLQPGDYDLYEDSIDWDDEGAYEKEEDHEL